MKSGPGSDLPRWLWEPEARNGRAAAPGTRAAILPLRALGGLVLLGIGGLAGWSLRGAPAPVAVATPVASPASACPTSAACVPAMGAAGISRARAQVAISRGKPAPAAPAALAPLPEAPPLDDDARRAALRDFAQGKAPELRECVGDPDQGPLRKVGAAFEIDDRGTVAAVQVLGGDGISPSVRRCCGKKLKSWTFPQDLLRGDESLLVSFVF